MEVAGINDFQVSGCSFQTQTLSGSDDANLCYEAIQLDILQETHFPGYTSEDLATKNVTIDNCTFTDVPRGVGSHTTMLNNPLDTISITNCTFKNCDSAAIHGMNWINCTISGNTITNCARGIALYSIRTKGTYLASTLNSSTSISVKYSTPASNQNIVIKNNTITCKGDDAYAEHMSAAIILCGLSLDSAYKNSDKDLCDSLPAGNYYISGATISGNTISTNRYGIYLSDVRSTTVSSNKVTCTGTSSSDVYSSITVTDASQNNTVNENTVSSKNGYGVYVNSDSTVKNIKNNSVTSAGKDGIRIYDGSVVTTVSGNTITSPKENGIYVIKATATTIGTGNKISSPGKNGISVYGSSATVKTISSNTISSAKEAGINVDKAGTVTTIKGNTIKKTSSHGIFLHNKAIVKTISSNTITSPKKDGLRVESSSKATTVKSNTISSPSVYGIYVYNSGKISTVSSNTISSAGKYGIGVDKGTLTTIQSNKISSPANHGIFVQNSGKIKTIKNNTIKNGKARGISIKSVKCDMTISGNTVSSCKGEALIYLNPDSTKYTIKVSKNSLTGTSSVNGIYGLGCKVTISGNTIKSANKAVYLTTTVKGTVGKNTYSGNKSNGVTNGSKVYKNVSTPSSVKASKKSSTSVKLSWGEVSGASGYIVYRATSKDGTYEKCSTISKGSTVSYTDKSLKKGKTYYYKVVAIKKSSNEKITFKSGYSKVVSMKL
ncbi:MAG: right-handed parallel beta-helix repeat-containing protein [Clostridiales bacterium]|nr:right-handed parallel beta-helix repeat-containing protein [Clostridiales bacterium]